MLFWRHIGIFLQLKDISKQFLYLYNLSFLKYKNAPGDYCEGVIPDPIPNSEVKPFCADGTLS